MATQMRVCVWGALVGVLSSEGIIAFQCRVKGTFCATAKIWAPWLCTPVHLSPVKKSTPVPKALNAASLAVQIRHKASRLSPNRSRTGWSSGPTKRRRAVSNRGVAASTSMPMGWGLRVAMAHPPPCDRLQNSVPILGRPVASRSGTGQPSWDKSSANAARCALKFPNARQPITGDSFLYKGMEKRVSGIGSARKQIRGKAVLSLLIRTLSRLSLPQITPNA